MQKNHDQFVHLLKTQALKQSRLEESTIIPSFLYPVTTYIGENPWQSLVLSSFLTSWLLLLLQFEFFFNLVQNIR